MRPPTALLCLAAAALLSHNAPAQSPPDPTEARIIAAVDATNSSSIALLQQIVDINSGTMNIPGVLAVRDILVPRIQALGFQTTWHPMDQLHRAGDLVAVHPCPAGTGHCGKRILAIGHMDTVFELASPFQKYSIVPGTNGNVATGPGVNDMKGGLVVLLSALDALRQAGALDHTEITIVLSGDEEAHGFPTAISRKDMIEAGQHTDLALEYESGGWVDGKDAASISRRSAGTWEIHATGKTGHSSGIFSDQMGDGAIYELARILEAFRTQLSEPGLTYNVGLITGGTSASVHPETASAAATGKSNVIPPIAIAIGDMRCLSNDQIERTRTKMLAIVAAHLPQTSATITFAEGYPAMAPTPASHALAVQLNQINATLGYPPMEEMDPMLRGAGDIAFVAPYVPGLVGTGAAGEGSHAEGETVFLDSIGRQAKRSALLIYRLSKQ
ncbi:MAG TPA: M20/M25/M40 family metallo-hydrolase [Acidobacteriaceae bacterium]|jgi:glutamate carboxypeptidase|nr:M20/M25/M40 family metallo-hydrolase [Acidobacteriaceae bacterium]